VLTFLEFITERSINVNLSHRDITSHLKTKGWSLDRTHGGHDIYTHPKSQTKIPVPRHRIISPGVVRNIVKSADVSAAA
jgi:predicted RNA binding protein YcfA (HicA-like mRNA interferase family)